MLVSCLHCLLPFIRTYHRNESSDESEVEQVVWVHRTGWIDLEGVVVLVGIFEQTVHWIQHLRGVDSNYNIISSTRVTNYLV